MPEIEHHWHTPTQGQVTKALFQYLADQNITTEKINEVVEKKVEQVLQGKIDTWVNTAKFDKLIIDAVAHYVMSEKKAYTDSRYGFDNRLRYLIEQELTKLLLKDYEVKVTPKVKEN